MPLRLLIRLLVIGLHVIEAKGFNSPNAKMKEARLGGPPDFQIEPKRCQKEAWSLVRSFKPVAEVILHHIYYL